MSAIMSTHLDLAVKHRSTTKEGFMAFSGSGGPPPKQAREQGLAGGNKPFNFRFFETLQSGKPKQIQFISLDQERETKVGEKDVKILILDEAPPGGDEWNPSVHIHTRFRYGGSWENYSICRHKTPEGCLLDVALQEKHTHARWCKKPKDESNPQEGECDRLGKSEPKKGVWRWAATAIKMKPYTVRGGPNKGKVIPYTRGLLLAGEDQYKDFLAYRKAFKGLRGRLFNVSRSDGGFSARIGDNWDPIEEWTDEKMHEYFADAAADYGLSVEDYTRPIDYEQVLRLPTVKEISDVARWVAGERNIDLNADLNASSGSKSSGASASSQGTTSTATSDEENEDDVPF
jgi:hypothetical protein